jgi:hypothetical protein
MADAKPPTRPLVAPARRSRVRDPRVDSSPPTSESSAASYAESPIDEASESRPKGGPVSRTSRAAVSLGPTTSDTQAVLAQLAALEEEMILLRDQKEKDEAMLGQMLARVADREQEARQARGETQRFEERATIAEMKVAALEAEMADLDRAAMEPLPGGALEEAEAATRAAELEEALAKVAKLEKALADASREHGAEGGKFARGNSAELDIARAKIAEAEAAYARIAVLEDALRSARSSTDEARSRAKELEAKLAEAEARAREVNEDRETATLVATELAEKVETLESRLEAAEAVGRAAVEAKEAAESQARARLDRIGELESALVVRDGRLDAAEMHLDEAKESTAQAEERAKALEVELAKANIAAGELRARMEGLAAELAEARGTLEDAGARNRNLENDFADRTKELVSERAERRASEATLKKRHEESLGQQKAMFERQLEGLEGQLAEAKASKEKVELSFKEFRGRSQEMQAEVASLEERLAFALEERATNSRQMVTMKGDADRLAHELHVARRELAHGREMVTRFSLAMMQLEKIDHDAVALRERLFNETRQAVLSLPSPMERAMAPRVESTPSADASAGANGQVSSAVASAPQAPLTPAPPTRTFSSAPSPVSAQRTGASAPPAGWSDRSPAGASSPIPKPLETSPSPAAASAGESEISFASVAPPQSGQLRAVAPLLRAPGERTAGRTSQMPSEPPPRGPTSDSEIRISVEEDEGWDEEGRG